MWTLQKKFKRVKTFREHRKLKHKNEKISVTDKNASDYVFNYSVNALALCYLAKNFIDARKHGDGTRITRMYKYLLMYFKLDSRTKYSYQTLHLLAQIKILLPPSLSHELTWNRFTNNKGKIDWNVELDRELEYRNKYVKIDLSQYQGEISTKSINPCSRSYNEMQSIMNNLDSQLEIKKPSGRHGSASWVTDVKELGKNKQKSIYLGMNQEDHILYSHLSHKTT